jgi:hypothetical protein
MPSWGIGYSLASLRDQPAIVQASVTAAEPTLGATLSQRPVSSGTWSMPGQHRTHQPREHDVALRSPRSPLWQVVIVTLVMTHITIAAVTDLSTPVPGAPCAGPAPGGDAFFPLLALADHRHGHQGMGRGAPQASWPLRNGPQDPHSPQVFGLGRVFGRALSSTRPPRATAPIWSVTGSVRPDDWLERNLYSRYSWQGCGLMLVLDPAACSGSMASPFGPCRCCGYRCSRPASSTASDTFGATAISRPRTPPPTSSPWGV